MPEDSSIEIDIRIAASGWRTALPGANAAIRKAVQAALKSELPKKTRTALSILLTEDAEMRKLNAGWRAKDKPTNVLSFPAENAVDPSRPPPYLGDIALGLSTCRREAREQGKTLADHVTHLAVHGVLHLLGYDHMDDDQAEAMEPLETAILAAMGIADPYKSSAPTAKKATKKIGAKKKPAVKKIVSKKKSVVKKKPASVKAPKKTPPVKVKKKTTQRKLAK